LSHQYLLSDTHGRNSALLAVNQAARAGNVARSKRRDSKAERAGRNSV